MKHLVIGLLLLQTILPFQAVMAEEIQPAEEDLAVVISSQELDNLYDEDPTTVVAFSEGDTVTITNSGETEKVIRFIQDENDQTVYAVQIEEVTNLETTEEFTLSPLSAHLVNDTPVFDEEGNEIIETVAVKGEKWNEELILSEQAIQLTDLEGLVFSSLEEVVLTEEITEETIVEETPETPVIEEEAAEEGAVIEEPASEDVSEELTAVEEPVSEEAPAEETVLEEVEETPAAELPKKEIVAPKKNSLSPFNVATPSSTTVISTPLLTKQSDLYTGQFGYGRQTALAPQRLNVLAFGLNGWMYIETWMGLWIKDGFTGTTPDIIGQLDKYPNPTNIGSIPITNSQYLWDNNPNTAATLANTGIAFEFEVPFELGGIHFKGNTDISQYEILFRTTTYNVWSHSVALTPNANGYYDLREWGAAGQKIKSFYLRRTGGTGQIAINELEFFEATVDIRDAELRSCINRTLGRTNESSPIYASDVENLETLDCSNLIIRGLEGLEKIKSLKTFKMNSNRFVRSYEQLASLPNLRHVEVSHSHLTDISFFEGLNLTTFNASYNRLVESDIAPFFNKGITNLNFNGNFADRPGEYFNFNLTSSPGPVEESYYTTVMDWTLGEVDTNANNNYISFFEEPTATSANGNIVSLAKDAALGEYIIRVDRVNFGMDTITVQAMDGFTKTFTVDFEEVIAEDPIIEILDMEVENPAIDIAASLSPSSPKQQDLFVPGFAVNGLTAASWSVNLTVSDLSAEINGEIRTLPVSFDGSESISFNGVGNYEHATPIKSQIDLPPILFAGTYTATANYSLVVGP